MVIARAMVLAMALPPAMPARRAMMCTAAATSSRFSPSAISSASSSWGSIPLGKVLHNLQFFEGSDVKQVEAELSGCTVLGTLCQDAQIYSQVGSVVTALKDEGDSSFNIKLVVQNFVMESTQNSESMLWFPKGAKVRIAEPRVILFQGKAVALMVDNPASMEVMTVELLSGSNQRSGKSFWSAANEAFREGEFLRAAHYYRECVEHGFPGALQAYSRSSAAWLELRYFEKAFLDATKALAHNPSHFKSLFVKAQALCGMQEYSKALDCFQEAESAASDSDEKSEVVKARQMCFALNEQSRTGIYDLTSFCLGGRLAKHAPECADFVGSVRIGAVEGKGRGLFATKDFKAGELIVVSRSVAVASKRGEEFRANMCRACMVNRRAIAQLTAYFDQSMCDLDLDLFRPNSDWYFRNRDHVVPSSSYRLLLKDAGKRNGLCPLATMINHSCLPNVSRRNVGLALFVRAAKDISEGEELVTSYFNSFLPLKYRSLQVKDRSFNFICSCPRCKLEEQIDDELATRYYGAVAGGKVGHAAIQELVNISQELNKIATDKKTKQWLMTSYFYAYWAAAYVGTRDRNAMEANVEEALLAVRETVPGDLNALYKMLELLNYGGPPTGGPISCSHRQRQLLREEAVCSFGHQSDAVLDAIIGTLRVHDDVSF